MNDLPNNPTEPIPVEEMVHLALHNVQQGIRHRFHYCENQIRKSPTTSVAGAVALGYLMHRLPVRAIFLTNIRVLTALAPPALILFGAAKIYDYFQSKKSSGLNEIE